MSRNSAYSFLLALLFIATAAGLLPAQTPRVVAALDSTYLQVGGKRTIRLRVHYPPGVKLLEAGTGLVDTAQAIELLEESPWDTLSNTSQTIVIEKELLLTAWDSGYYQIPPIPVPFEIPGRKDTAYSNPLLLQAGLAPQDTVALQPLKPIIEEPLKFEDFVPYLLGLFATLALVALAWWFWKRKNRQPQPEPQPADVIPPHIIAMEQLDALEKARLWQAGQIKEYHTQLTYILRAYLEERFHILALESTSREIAGQLKNLIDENLRQNIIHLLNTSDMVKFAKAEPPESVHADLLAQAREFVQKTAKHEP